MTIEAKIINKILANRMQQHINRIIYHNEVRLSLGMQEWCNMQKTNTIHYLNRIKKTS